MYRLHLYRRAFTRYGASNKCEVGKTSHFPALNVNISKTVEIRPKLLLMTNWKSYMGFRLTPRSMTLDDLELLEVRIFLEFRAISYIWKATTAKRMEIRPVPQRQRQPSKCTFHRCIDFVDIRRSSARVLQFNYITPRRAGLSATAGLSCNGWLSK